MNTIINLCNKLDSDIKTYISDINKDLNSIDDKTSINHKINTLVRITYCRVQLIEIRKEIIKLNSDSNIDKETGNKAIDSIKVVEDYVYNIIDNTNRLTIESLIDSYEKINSMLEIAISIKDLLVMNNTVLSELIVS